MEKNRARVVDHEGREVLSGAFDGLKVGLNMYPKQMKVSVELAYYGLTAPEGELIEVGGGGWGGWGGWGGSRTRQKTIMFACCIGGCG